jgi:hypothetical protein
MAMVERGYGLSAGDVVIASTWLRRNKPDTPVSLPDVLSAEAFDRAQVHPAYVHADVDNIHIIERPSGTSRRRSLRRLRDQRSTTTGASGTVTRTAAIAALNQGRSVQL